MLTNKPLVSVIMTVRNARPFLREAIESILKQTYSHLELIIVDDGSTDGSIEIIRNLASGDKRIKSVFLDKNYGPSYASNVGIKMSKGVYIARMDADDIAYPARIEKQVNFFERNPNVILLGGQCQLINENGQIIGRKKFPLKHKEIYNSLFRMNPIQHPSCMINTHLIHRNIIVYHNHFVLAHDLELIFDLTRYGKLANLGGNILYYRQHPDSLSLKDPKETFRATIKIRRKAVKYYGYKPTLWEKLLICCKQSLFLPFQERQSTRFIEFLGCRKLKVFQGLLVRLKDILN